MTTSFQNTGEDSSESMAAMVSRADVEETISTLSGLDHAAGMQRLAEMSAIQPALFLAVVGAALEEPA